MPILLVALALLGLVALLAISVPLSIVQRYRAGTARRRARGWIAATNTFLMGLSAAIFLSIAGISSTWLPGAFAYSFAGMAGGAVLGVLGLAISHWEITPRSLHFTPNRWLVLTITLVVFLRLAFGLWRAWRAWRLTPDEQSWLAESGIAGSMAVGAVVLGYYLVYWAGVWMRVRRHRVVSRSK